MLWPEPVEAVSYTTLLGPRNQEDDATRRPAAFAQRAAVDRAWRIADECLERNSVYINGDWFVSVHHSRRWLHSVKTRVLMPGMTMSNGR